MTFLRMRRRDEMPTDEQDRQNAQCSGKQQYRSFGEAEQTLKHIRHHHKVNIYRCKFCSFWHYGETRHNASH